MVWTTENLVDAEADDEFGDENDSESDSDFDIEHEKALKKWTAK